MATYSATTSWSPIEPGNQSPPPQHEPPRYGPPQYEPPRYEPPQYEPPRSEPPPAPEPERPGRDRSGAIWVTATGAFLLLAAAATFVSVRWDQLHDWQKFGALVVVTQLLLVGGWLGRRRVPATAAATFSLGAVLVPLDAWTIGASGAGDWRRGLFVGGAVAVLTLPLARRLFDTVALKWAWTTAVPVAAAGVAAMAGFPPPAMVVAALGLVALSARRHRDGLTWLAIGAVTPLVTLADPALPFGHGVMNDLGLTGPALPWTTAATAVLVIAAVAINGKRLGRADAVAVGGVLALADVAAAFAIGHVPANTWWITVAALVLGAEIVALVGDADVFWSRFTGRMAVGAGTASVVVASLLLGALTDDGDSLVVTPPTASLAAALLALAWLVSDQRGGARRWRTGLLTILTGDSSAGHALAVATMAAIAVATLPVATLWIGVGFIALGAGFLIGRRSTGAVTGTILTTIGTLVTLAAFDPNPLITIAATATGLAVIAWGARRQQGVGATLAVSTVAAVTLAVDAVWLALTIDLSRVGHGDLRSPLTLAVAIAGWVLGSIAARRDRPGAALAPWALSIGAAMSGLDGGLSPLVALLIPAIGVGWLLGDAAWRRHAVPAIVAAITTPMLSAALLARAGYVRPQAGVGLAIVAIAIVGVSLATTRRARLILLVGAGAHLVAGGLLASSEPGPLGIVVLIAGLLWVAVAIIDRVALLAYNGAAITLLGSWQALAGYGVATPEAYLAPLAVVLLAAGVHARMVGPVSSWVAYSGPIVVLGGSAFAMRVAGHPGWHGLLAGAVAVAAVAAGSWRRLAAPIFLGSALLVAVTVNETLTRSAGVPTWIWLALGGCALLGAGVTMELRGLGPVESGRRVVRLVAERFE